MSGAAEEPQDPLKRWIAITLSLLVVVGGAIAIQEATGSVNESNTARETTRVAVRAMSARVALDAVLRAQAGLRGERAFLPYRPPLSAGVARGELQAARREVPTGRAPAELDRLRFIAAHETLRQTTLATTRITWNDVATRYTTAIAILAAGLFFVGFSLTVEGPPRRISFGLGIATGLFAAGWTVYIHEIPIPGTPERALAAAARGAVLAQHGDFRAASTAYDRAIRVDGGFAAAYTGRANARLLFANPDYPRTKAFTDAAGRASAAAARDARRALALGGSRDLLGFGLVGIEAIYSGAYGEALRAADGGLAINRRVPDLWLLRSAAALGLGQAGTASATLGSALDLVQAAGPSRRARQLSSDYLSYLAAVAAHVPARAAGAQRLADRFVAFETAFTLGRTLDGSLPATGGARVARLRYARGRLTLVLRWHGLPPGTAISAIEYERPQPSREWTQPTDLALFLDVTGSGRRRLSPRLQRACEPTAVRVDLYLNGVRALTRTGRGVAPTC
jgi:tetratricopeptide (TPR) repeat protein